MALLIKNGQHLIGNEALKVRDLSLHIGGIEAEAIDGDQRTQQRRQREKEIEGDPGRQKAGIVLGYVLSGPLGHAPPEPSREPFAGAREPAHRLSEGKPEYNLTTMMMRRR